MFISKQGVSATTTAVIGIWAAMVPGYASADGLEMNEAEKEFRALHDAYVARFKPLFIRSNEAWWHAAVTGTDEAFAARQEAANALVDLHSDRETFAKLKAFKESDAIQDPLSRRLLQVMYNTFLPGQGDVALQKKIVALESDIEQIFNNHRSVVDGEAKTENDVRAILAETTDSSLAEKAWKGYMAVGAKVSAKLATVVRLRNLLATELGFQHFFALRLTVQEINQAELFKLFDELDDLTRQPMIEVKREIDEKMAARFGMAPAELRPWHVGDLFFQEAPRLEDVSLDDMVKDKDPLALCADYYASIGMPIEDIVKRSDLYEKPGKSPHAFCTDVNRADDIRVLANVKPNGYWMDTMMHELGHGVYDKYIGADVPFVLHEPAHILTTEGIAMMFGALCRNEDWLSKVLRLPPEQANSFVRTARRAQRAEKIIFSRWTQVMLRFEHAMYNNPDRDLAGLWWDLKAKYQLLHPPQDRTRPDYAAKVHVITVPAYYHNYMMGDLFGAQVHEYIARQVLGVSDPQQTSFYGRRKAGAYLRDKVFRPGNLHRWNELTRMATGRPLSAEPFARLYLHASDGS